MSNRTPEEDAAFDRCVDYLSIMIEKYANQLDHSLCASKQSKQIMNERCRRLSRKNNNLDKHKLVR